MHSPKNQRNSFFQSDTLPKVNKSKDISRLTQDEANKIRDLKREIDLLITKFRPYDRQHPGLDFFELMYTLTMELGTSQAQAILSVLGEAKKALDTLNIQDLEKVRKENEGSYDKVKTLFRGYTTLHDGSILTAIATMLGVFKGQAADLTEQVVNRVEETIVAINDRLLAEETSTLADCSI